MPNFIRMYTNGRMGLNLVAKVLGLLVIVFTSHGQTLLSPAVVRKNSLHTLAQHYDKALGDHARLYNGQEYVDLYANKLIDGHPYFLDEEYQAGSVMYDGSLYQDIQLRYNLFQNSVVVEHPKTHREIELVAQKLDRFQIQNVLFVRLTQPEPGYYAQLYSGSISFYGRYYKTIQERVDAKAKITAFIPKTRYYLLKDNTYHVITSKSSVLKILENQKSELRKFLNQERISFRNNREYALKRIGEKYDQLTAAR